MKTQSLTQKLFYTAIVATTFAFVACNKNGGDGGGGGGTSNAASVSNNGHSGTFGGNGNLPIDFTFTISSSNSNYYNNSAGNYYQYRGRFNGVYGQVNPYGNFNGTNNYNSNQYGLTPTSLQVSIVGVLDSNAYGYSNSTFTNQNINQNAHQISVGQMSSFSVQVGQYTVPFQCLTSLNTSDTGLIELNCIVNTRNSYNNGFGYNNAAYYNQGYYNNNGYGRADAYGERLFRIRFRWNSVSNNVNGNIEASDVQDASATDTNGMNNLYNQLQSQI